MTRLLPSALTLCAMSLAAPAILAQQRQPATPTEPAPAQQQQQRAQRHSKRTRLQIQVVDGPRFTIPGDWYDWFLKFRNNLNTRPTAKALDPKQAGEWDREYGTVLDAALPLRDCAFAGGGEAFGKDAVGFGDLQLRVYVIKASAKEVDGLLDTKGAEALRKTLAPQAWPLWLERSDRKEPDRKQPPPIERFRPQRQGNQKGQRPQKGPWRRSRWAFDLWFHDYGGRAHIDVRTRQFGEHTAVFAFCYAWEKQHAKTIEAILESVEWPERGLKKAGK